MSETVTSTLQATRSTFPEGMREAEVCTYIFNLIEKLRGGFECISLAELATQLKWQNDRDALKSIQKVLHFLTYGEKPIFIEKFILWAEEESGDTLETEEWVFTYEEIIDFTKKIQVIYCANDFAREIAKISRGVF